MWESECVREQKEADADDDDDNNNNNNGMCFVSIHFGIANLLAACMGVSNGDGEWCTATAADSRFNIKKPKYAFKFICPPHYINCFNMVFE